MITFFLVSLRDLSDPEEKMQFGIMNEYEKLLFVERSEALVVEALEGSWLKYRHLQGKATQLRVYDRWIDRIFRINHGTIRYTVAIPTDEQLQSMKETAHAFNAHETA